MKDRCNWKLNKAVFQRILAKMGPMEVDLFASSLSRQLPRFYSWRPGPEAEATDAFMQDWLICRGFANPPWCLIPRCLTKVRAQATRIVVITPLWPTQPWYPLVLELLEDYPRRIQPGSSISTPGPGVHNAAGCAPTNRVAYPTHHEAFLNKLQTSCLPHGEKKPTQTMGHHSLNGLASVNNGIEIPFQDL